MHSRLGIVEWGNNSYACRVVMRSMSNAVECVFERLGKHRNNKLRCACLCVCIVFMFLDVSRSRYNMASSMEMLVR